METTKKKTGKKSSKANVNPTLAVYLAGPFKTTNIQTKDESLFWTVKVAFNHQDPSPKYSYRTYNEQSAANLAQKISKDQGITVIQ